MSYRKFTNMSMKLRLSSITNIQSIIIALLLYNCGRHSKFHVAFLVPQFADMILLCTKVLNANVEDVVVRDVLDCQAWDCKGAGISYL